jgi:hypothetical protein
MLSVPRIRCATGFIKEKAKEKEKEKQVQKQQAIAKQ